MKTFTDLENYLNKHPMDPDLTELYAPPPKAETIRQAETILGVVFPEDYKNALLKWGIIFTPGIIVYGICADDVNNFGGPNVVTLTQDARDKCKLPDYYIAIHDEEGDELWCIDTKKIEGPVVVWDWFDEDITRTCAGSFSEFVLGLLE